MLTWTDRQLDSFASLPVDVHEENLRQLTKWGIQTHPADTWMSILTEEVGELAQAILWSQFSGAPYAGIKKEAIQVATLALKIAEMCGEDEPSLPSAEGVAP